MSQQRALPPASRTRSQRTRRCLPVLLAGALLLATSAPQAAIVDVIEYHNRAQGRYFITALDFEIAALDAGTIAGWQRTGYKFQAHDRRVNGTTAVCRYHLPPAKGGGHVLSSSAAECAQIAYQFPQYIRESDAVMFIAHPDHVTGRCKSGQQPVYRLWDESGTSRHRYVVDRGLRDRLVRQGWVAEGHGQDPVAMCGVGETTEPVPVTASLPPPCKGPNSRVAVPAGPHGMYVWNPGPALLPYLEKDVIGKDPTLCGASLVIFWSAVNPSKGVYDWTPVINAAQPFVNAGLTVNLLFSEATEGATNQVTPAWVTAPVASGGAGAPSVSCANQPTMPVYWDPTYEAAWTTFIAAAMQQFSFGNSALAANVGYMRFATGGGAEALPPPGYNDGGACEAAWAAAGYTYDAWNQHYARIATAIGSNKSDKQVMISLPQVAGGATVYTVSNLGADEAAALGLGLSFENLGMSGVAAPGTTPGPCDPTAKLVNLHWCQAYQKYAGKVPLAMQPITATTNTSVATMDIDNLLQYALANRIQVFELYPEEWLMANSPTWPSFVASEQAKYQAALQEAAQTLGATNGQ